MSDFDSDPDIDSSDDQTGAEVLDADKIGDAGSDYPENFPLDRSVGVEDYGTTSDEEETGESVRRRTSREVPDFDEPDFRSDDDSISLAGLTESDGPEDGELLADLGDEAGPETAEEAAMHVVDEP